MMFVGAVMTWAAMRHGDTPAGQGKDGREETKPHRSGFTQRMEERFRKRFEGE
jgi:hypothetical protein